VQQNTVAYRTWEVAGNDRMLLGPSSFGLQRSALARIARIHRSLKAVPQASPGAA
jgi:hypothetical protein